MTGPSPASRIPRDRGYGIPRATAPVDLRLDGNEGRAPGPELLAELAASDPDLLRCYPSGNELEQALAARLGIAADSVLVTAGADEALDRACRAVLEPGRELVLPVPTFEMIERYAALAGARVVEVPWRQGPYPLAEVLQAVTPHTAAIAVVSPNNPTGLTATAEDLVELSRRVPQALLLADLAYAEFCGPDRDLTATALGLPNAVVIRTLSKAFGLAGLRVGYAAGPAEILRWMRVCAGPYPVAALARKIALRRLQTGAAEVEEYVLQVAGERRRLTALLSELGLQPLPSEANFVFARSRDPLWVRDALAGLGIAVRAFPGKPGLEDGLRITVPGESQQYSRLEEALRTALRPEALLLDLDGVVADVPSGRPLAEPGLLQRLARRLPLGMVTGCSRRTTEELLQRLGIRSCFAALVTADDAPPKPDPRSVATAQQALSKRAWMVGDTTADVRAARGAGALPIGLRDPADARHLLDAGAARVVQSLAEVERLLP